MEAPAPATVKKLSVSERSAVRAAASAVASANRRAKASAARKEHWFDGERGALARLNKDGYVLVQSPLRDVARRYTRGQLARLKRLVEAYNNTIFQKGSKDGSQALPGDRKRKMAPVYHDKVAGSVDAQSKTVELCSKIVEDMRVYLPLLTHANEDSFLLCLPGASEQEKHIDQPWTPDFRRYVSVHPLKVGVSVLVALEHPTWLIVWPGSHLMVRAFEQDVDNPPTDSKRRPIDRTTVHIPVGSMLIFFVTLVHAGSGYTEANLRVHMHFDNVRKGAGCRPKGGTQFMNGRPHSTEEVFLGGE